MKMAACGVNYADTTSSIIESIPVKFVWDGSDWLYPWGESRTLPLLKLFVTLMLILMTLEILHGNYRINYFF